MHTSSATGKWGELYSEPVKPLLLWVAPQAAHRLKCHWRQFLSCCLLLLLLVSCFSASPQLLLLGEQLTWKLWAQQSRVCLGVRGAFCSCSQTEWPKPAPALLSALELSPTEQPELWVTSPVCHEPPMHCQWNKGHFKNSHAISLISQHTVAVICFWEGLISSRRDLYL